MTRTKKKLRKAVKKYAPIMLGFLMFSSLLVSFTMNASEKEEKRELDTKQVLLLLNVSGQEPRAGKVLIPDNSTAFDLLKEWFSLKVDRTSTGLELVCVQGICNLPSGEKWYFLVNENKTNDTVDEYVPDFGDLIELRYF